MNGYTAGETLFMLLEESNDNQFNIVESLQDGHTKKRTLSIKRKEIWPNFVFFRPNSVKSNLYKADNSIKRTLIYGPNDVHFREIPLYFQNS